ncbi:MAG TPA: trypsin-like peptidase domain-containing protein [Rubrobacteraceae bacterium]|nr:trypsin-like peptidase domain-containing protein [Rubrobacteraceae bacterium]
MDTIGGRRSSALFPALSPEIEGLVSRAQQGVVQVRDGGRDAGAGVIWDGENGLVMTNYHVVARASRGGAVQVVLRDNRELATDVVKCDRRLDLALLRLDGAPGDLTQATFGDSDVLRVGEFVFAVGHPWGRLGAVTVGIVSGRLAWGRRGGRVAHVRSDVALAPGNSGGPLLNSRGEVVGINAMVYGGTALSIPSNAATAWASEPESRGPRLGVGIMPVDLPDPLRSESGCESGLIVAAVEAGRPAARAGLLVGDVLLAAAGEAASDFEALANALARAGDHVRLRVLRGGQVFHVEVSLREPGRAA